MTRPRPDYIARGGDLVMAPPLDLLGATMYLFLVCADLDALTRMVDAQLNAVTRAAAQASGQAPTIYRPLAPMAAIVCCDVIKSFSKTPPDADKGWMGERDFGVWIPVVAGSEAGGAWKPGKIAWYLPYVFVDNVAAMVTGREVFGFFKQIAALAMPPAPSAPGLFSIDALVIPTFSPSSQAQTLRLLTMTSHEGSAAPDGGWKRFEDVLGAIWDLVKQRFFAPGRGAITAWDLVKNMVEDLATGDVPMVFLKQFRDAGDPTKACYQAVIEAPAHLEKFHGGWFTHPHDVTVLPCASHPIVEECGLPGASFVAEHGFWCKMDFAMQPGKVIAESS